MKQLSLKVESRNETGSAASGRLRKAGKIPAIIYGDEGTRNISIEEFKLRQLMRSLHGTTALIELEDEKGQKTLSVLKDLSRHSVTDLFLHVDFNQISINKEMNVELNVHVTGESIGVKNENGVLEVHAHSVSVRCLPKDLPEIIDVDVTALHAGDAIHIKDLKPIDGVTFTGDPEIVVVTCTGEAAPAEEPAEAATA